MSIHFLFLRGADLIIKIKMCGGGRSGRNVGAGVREIFQSAPLRISNGIALRCITPDYGNKSRVFA